MFNSLKALINSQKKPQSVQSAPVRFIQLFEQHGIQASQIPRLIPKLKLSHLATPESLLDALTPEIIDQAAQFFAVRPEWLEGADDLIYQTHFCYKSPERFFEHFNTLKPNSSCCPIRVLALNKNLDYRSGEYQPIALVIVETVQLFGDDFIDRYHIYTDSWDWSHKPCRIQLKAMARLLGRIHQIPIFQVSQQILDSVVDGRMIPHPYLYAPLLSEPCLDDFSESPEVSVVAKDLEELPEVLAYIETNKLEALTADFIHYSKRVAETWYSSSSDAPEKTNTADKSRKAAISKNASGNQIKQDFISRNASSAKDKSFNVSEAARNFYDNLSEEDAIKLFRSEKDFQKLTSDEARINAVRTLTNAFRNYKKTKTL